MRIRSRTMRPASRRWRTFWINTATRLVLSVPEPEFLQGDFSKLVDNQGRQILIYDPSTGHDVNGTWVRTPFAGNKIPPSKLNPIAQKILGFHPKPNQPFA